MPVIGKNMISWFYAYVEHIEIKTKTVNEYNAFSLPWSIPKCQNPWCTLFIEKSKEFRMQTFMIWIKERFLCHVYYIQMDMWT